MSKARVHWDRMLEGAIPVRLAVHHIEGFWVGFAGPAVSGIRCLYDGSRG